MKKRISFILCIAMVICTLSTGMTFAAKSIKAKSVTIAPKSMTLAVGDVAQLSAKMSPANSTDKLTWTTSDKSICTVSSKGVVQAVAEGTAKITVKTTSKKSAVCTVIVKEYMTKDEVIETINENPVSESKVTDLIKKVLSGEYVTRKDADSILNGIVNDRDFVTRSEVSRMINQYTVSSGTSSGGSIYPAGSFEWTYASKENNEYEGTIISFDPIQISYKSINFDEIANSQTVQDYENYTYKEYSKYELSITVSGKTDPSLAGEYIFVNINSTDHDCYNGGREYFIDTKVNEDGTFSKTEPFPSNSKDDLIFGMVTFSSYIAE